MGVPALTLEPEAASYALPSVANGNYGWCTRSYTQDCLWSDGPTQYAIWVDDNKKARLARRNHTKAWESSIDLSAATGSVLTAAFADDSHNIVTVATDDRGYVHVVGDLLLAAIPTKYMRTVQPGSINTWTSGASLVGSEETSNTYPQFVKFKNQQLGLFHRSGSSDSAKLVLDTFDSAAKTWARTAVVIDGTGSSHSPYPNHIAVDRNSGRMHLMWTWRDTSDGATNEDICYAYSDDNGANWKKSDDSAYSLPITRATSEVAADYPADKILNNSGLEVDASGRPHSGWAIKDGGGVYQIHHIYHTGSAWVDDTVTSYATSAPRPAVACFNDGRVWLIFATGAGGRGGYIRILDVTTSTTSETVIHAVNCLSYEPSFDTQIGRAHV